MQFGAGTTITHTPTAPAGTPYPGTVHPDGSLEIAGERYEYVEASDDYRRQQPGNPPGGWTIYSYSNDDPPAFERHEQPKESSAPIHTQSGDYSAVA